MLLKIFYFILLEDVILFRKPMPKFCTLMEKHEKVYKRDVGKNENDISNDFLGTFFYDHSQF